MPIQNAALNGPGVPARWTSSAKTGVGTALSDKSHIWFTLSHGIFNEIYYPHIDQACTRDMGLIVTDGMHFFSEEKRNADSQVQWMADGVPAFNLVNICHEHRYRIEKQIVTDSQRDTVLQQTQFIPLQGQMSDYKIYVLLAPHLENQGMDNTAWLAEFENTQLLFAQKNDCALALACSVPWLKRSVSYVGPSDGWHDLRDHKQMTCEYSRAERGNVALMAQIDLEKSGGNFLLALGFGKNPDEAARNALDSLKAGFNPAKHAYINGWQQWINGHTALKEIDPTPNSLSRMSLSVIRTHESQTPPGGVIASLSIPWGFNKGDKDLGGYYLVWSRDMVEVAGALLAAGAQEDVRRMLSFLQSTQHAEGYWPQNMWVDGSPNWTGIQMDETALPILLIDLALRKGALTRESAAQFWPMVRLAAGYLVRNGPVSPEDRWEEDPGYSQFTVGAEIAALLAAADLADLNQETAIANYLREVADVWNTSIDQWMYVSGTDWCHKFNVKGYYVRIVPTQKGEGVSQFLKDVHIPNVSAAEDSILTKHLISPDALALVRFGLRAADDPRMRDTVKVIDALLKIETPCGPTWHRYNDDGYGEHEDGSPFDGTGIGRGWPLLTGERAHYELAAGQIENAKQLLKTIESFSGENGLISEQVWDTQDIAEKGLYLGKPSGSAMPLVWAHAEYLKLRRSLHDGQIFDMPPQTVKRYLIDKTVSPRIIWKFNQKIRSMPRGKILRIETLTPAIIHWSADHWKTTQEVKTSDVRLGIHSADLMTTQLSTGNEVKFTFYWPEAKHWEGIDFSVRISS